jgi:hypothetical protein
VDRWIGGRSCGLVSWARDSRAADDRRGWRAGVALFSLLLFLIAALPAAGREKDKLAYGEGLIVGVPLAASEVEQVVQDIAQNGIIRGTKEYNKDEFISGAKAATSSRVFPAWTEGGKVFYKVREHAIDPRNFKDGGDVGTLVVRYVVQPQGEKNTVLHIDALFEEDFRHVLHQSDGSVENSEYKDIREHVEALQLMKKENVEAERERQQQPAQDSTTRTEESDGGAFPTPAQKPAPLQAARPSVPEAPEGSGPPVSQSSAMELPVQSVSNQVVEGQTPEEQVKELRKQLERLVKAPGAPLKSAPFHTASTLQSLIPGTEVLILISTPYWYGVETHEGQHGWIMRDQLEQP